MLSIVYYFNISILRGKMSTTVFADKYIRSNVLEHMDLQSLVCLSLSSMTLWNDLSQLDWEKLCVSKWGYRDSSSIEMLTLAYGLDWPAFNTQDESTTFWRHVCVRVSFKHYRACNDFVHNFEAAIALNFARGNELSCYSSIFTRVCSHKDGDARVAKIVIDLMNKTYVATGQFINIEYASHSAILNANKEVLREICYMGSTSSSDYLVLFKRFTVDEVLFIVRNTANSNVLNAAIIAKKLKFIQSVQPPKSYSFGKIDILFRNVKHMSVNMLDALISRKHLVGSKSGDIFVFLVAQAWCTPQHIDYLIKNTCILRRDLDKALLAVKSQACKNKLIEYDNIINRKDRK